MNNKEGILIINKPEGFTSQDVVSKVKKILNIKKAGHTGTLDPMATGVLPVLLGNYTKISKYLIEHDKMYTAKLKLGIKTDTGDIQGTIIEEVTVSENILDEKNVVDVFNKFIGKQKQIPPMYSAIKVNGKKLYEYARNGENVEVMPRDIEIYNIDNIKEYKEQKEIEFSVKCSKGTYIRVLCEDLAKSLGTIGCMSALRRDISGEFRLEDSITFENLEKINNEGDLKSVMFYMTDVFKKFPEIKLNKRKEELFFNGVLLTFNLEDGVYNIYTDKNKYIGLGTVKNNLLKRDVIL